MAFFKSIGARLRGRSAPLVVAAVLSSVAGVLLHLSLSGTASQASALAPDPLAILGGRSPGARPEGVLLQTKLRRDAVEQLLASVTPSERVLNAVRTRPAEPSFGAAGVPSDVIGGNFFPAGGLLPEVGDQAAGGSALPFPTTFTPTIGGVIGGGVVGGGGGGGGSGGGGSGGGSSGGGTVVTPPSVITPVPPVAAVPEPATWLSMIIGFGFIGFALRGRHRPVRVRATGSFPPA